MARLARLAEAPGALVSASPEVAGVARQSLQSLFLELASALPANAAACPELYTDGFDGEQIWVQARIPSEIYFLTAA